MKLAYANEVNELNHYRKKAEQIAREAGAERLRELNGIRSQIDFKGFINKLLKEEHRQIAAKILNIENDIKQSSATIRLKVRMEAAEKKVELEVKNSKHKSLNHFRTN